MPHPHRRNQRSSDSRRSLGGESSSSDRARKAAMESSGSPTTTAPSTAAEPPRCRDWRRPGQAFRKQLVVQDQAHHSFVLDHSCAIKIYYQVADKVFDQFINHSIDTRDELVEAYIVGTRLKRFLGKILPTHAAFDPRSVQHASAVAHMATVKKYLDPITRLIDEAEHSNYVSRVLDNSGSSSSLEQSTGHPVNTTEIAESVNSYVQYEKAIDGEPSGEGFELDHGKTPCKSRNKSSNQEVYDRLPMSPVEAAAAWDPASAASTWDAATATQQDDNDSGEFNTALEWNRGISTKKSTQSFPESISVHPSSTTDEQQDFLTSQSSKSRTLFYDDDDDSPSTAHRMSRSSSAAKRSSSRVRRRRQESEDAFFNNKIVVPSPPPPGVSSSRRASTDRHYAAISDNLEEEFYSPPVLVGQDNEAAATAFKKTAPKTRRPPKQRHSNSSSSSMLSSPRPLAGDGRSVSVTSSASPTNVFEFDEWVAQTSKCNNATDKQRLIHGRHSDVSVANGGVVNNKRGGRLQPFRDCVRSLLLEE